MKRDVALDYAKGIVIILMVMGHCYSSENIILKLIYSFHMPFFFVVSGILYGRKRQRIKNIGFGTQCQKIAKHLLVPYFIFEIIFSLFLVLMDRNNVWYMSLYQKLCSILSFKGVTATWYLSCIAFVEIFFIALYRKSELLTYLCAGILGIGALLATPYLSGYAVPAGRCCIGLLFFTVGFLIEKYAVDIYKKLKWYGVAVLIVIYVAVTMYNGMVSLVSLKLSNPCLYVLNALVGTSVILWFSYCLAQRDHGTKLLKVLETYGRHTMLILGTHMILIEIIRLVDYKVLNNMFSKLGIMEGVILGIVVCVINAVIIYLKNKIRVQNANR